MSKLRRWISAAFLLAAVLVLGALIESRFPIFAQAGRITGTYRLTISRGSGSDLEVLATANSDGIIVGTPVPLECVSPPYALSSGYGSWGIRGPRVRFQVQSLVLQNGKPVPGGPVRLAGTGDAFSRNGSGTIHIPKELVDACGASEIPFTFTSTPIPPSEQ
jgi:hypothetical protein